MKTTKAVSSKAVQTESSKATTTATQVGTAPTVVSSGTLATTSAAPTRPLTGLRLKLQQLLTGMQAVIPDGAALPMPGGATVKSTIVQELTDGLALYTAVDTQDTSVQTARQQLKGEIPSLRTLCGELKTALIATLGKSSPQLKQFGLVIKQPAPLSPEKQIAKTVRLRETRAIRGTTSKKQKAQLKYLGQVVVGTTQVSVPATQPASGSTTPVAPVDPAEASSGSATPAGSDGVTVGAQALGVAPPGSK